MDGDAMSMAKAERERILMERAIKREADPWAAVQTQLSYLTAAINALISLETEHKKLVQEIHQDLMGLRTEIRYAMTEAKNGKTH